MPQTETVLRQSMKEKAKPVLFVNKTDRLLNELRLTPEQTMERLMKLIQDINKLIEQYAPEEFAESWKVSVEGGSVAFGSAADRWAISKKSMDKSKISFKHIFELTAQGKQKELQDIAPVEDAVLPMIIEHLPTPKEAQPYRIPHLWHGDLQSEAGKAMLAVDAKAKTNGIIFGITYDQHSGEVAIARIFSGAVRKGLELNMTGKSNKQRIQQVGIFMAADRVIVDNVPAGNIAALIGLKDANVGDTISEDIIEPFEQITHYSKPVVTKAVEAKDTRDTIKLIEALRELSKEDPTIVVRIDQDTGEHLVSGMGELHLEIIETKLKDDFKIPIIASEPIVVYKETIEKKAGPIEGKSPNKHSRFYVTVEPLPQTVQAAFDEGAFREGKPKGQPVIEAMIKAGLERPIAKSVVDISNNCMLVDATKGVQYMNEVMELLIDGFEEAVRDGPLAKEKCGGIMATIIDATIHEDPVHRGPAQIIPAIRNAIYAGLLTSGVVLLEPKQNFTINIPQEYMSDIIGFVQSRRGQVGTITQDREQVSIVAKMPVAETLKGFSNDLRGETQGRAIWYQEFAGYEKMPPALQNEVVREIRKRKGLPEEPPAPDFFMS
jgi:elongation factor 2